MSKVVLTPAAILLCAVSPFSLAAEALPLEPLLVTASRTKQTASQSLAAVTVWPRCCWAQRSSAEVSR